MHYTALIKSPDEHVMADDGCVAGLREIVMAYRSDGGRC